MRGYLCTCFSVSVSECICLSAHLASSIYACLYACIDIYILGRVIVVVVVECKERSKTKVWQERRPQDGSLESFWHLHCMRRKEEREKPECQGWSKTMNCTSSSIGNNSRAANCCESIVAGFTDYLHFSLETAGELIDSIEYLVYSKIDLWYKISQQSRQAILGLTLSLAHKSKQHASSKLFIRAWAVKWRQTFDFYELMGPFERWTQANCLWLAIKLWFLLGFWSANSTSMIRQSRDCLCVLGDKPQKEVTKFEWTSSTNKVVRYRALT